MTEILYRPYLESDKAAVLSLFEASFGKPRETSQWNWEYNDARIRPIVVVAETSGKVVGHYAVLPRTIGWNGENVDAGLVVDVMTHPSFGRKGVFVNSALEAFSRAKEVGIDLLIGFPNEAAIRGHMKVGWVDLGYIRVYARPLGIKGILKTTMLGNAIPDRILDFADELVRRVSSSLLGPSSLQGTLRHISVRDFLNLEPSVENLIGASIPSDKIATVRSKNWLSWRLSDPSGIHDVIVAGGGDSRGIAGYAILKFREKGGLRLCVVLDFAVRRDGNRKIAAELMSEAIRAALSRECDACLMLGNPSLPLKNRFRRMMFIPTPKKLRLIAKPLSKSSMPAGYFDNRNWYIEFIDHDVL